MLRKRCALPGRLENFGGAETCSSLNVLVSFAGIEPTLTSLALDGSKLADRIVTCVGGDIGRAKPGGEGAAVPRDSVLKAGGRCVRAEASSFEASGGLFPSDEDFR